MKYFDEIYKFVTFIDTLSNQNFPLHLIDIIIFQNNIKNLKKLNNQVDLLENQAKRYDLENIFIRFYKKFKIIEKLQISTTFRQRVFNVVIFFKIFKNSD